MALFLKSLSENNLVEEGTVQGFLPRKSSLTPALASLSLLASLLQGSSSVFYKSIGRNLL